MPASNVPWGQPLTRLPPFYPGQWGVRGSDSRLGLRSHTDGAVFYVNPNHPDCNDAGDGTNPDAPLQTVAAAITKCLPFRGDVIAVMANNAWQYGTALDGYTLPIAENVIIDVPGVRLVGISQSSSTGVVWEATDDNQVLITVTAIDVSIEGFLFYAPAFANVTAITAIWDGAPSFGDNLTVRNCVFSESISNGIILDYCWYANIHHNVFWDLIDKGIEVIAPSPAEYLIIADNIFHDVTTTAIDLTNSDYCHVYGNSIYNDSNQAGAAGTDTGIVTTNGSHNQIFDNYFSCILPVAAAGDWDDMNTASATDAWIGNHCLNGLAITNPT